MSSPMTSGESAATGRGASCCRTTAFRVDEKSALTPSNWPAILLSCLGIRVLVRFPAHPNLRSESVVPQFRSTPRERGARCGEPYERRSLECPQCGLECIVKKIYVGNLSWDSNEQDLRELFEQFGAVHSVAIVMDRDTGRSRGFGFVEMDESEAQT